VFSATPIGVLAFLTAMPQKVPVPDSMQGISILHGIGHKTVPLREEGRKTKIRVLSIEKTVREEAPREVAKANLDKEPKFPHLLARWPTHRYLLGLLRKHPLRCHKPQWHHH